MISCYLIAWFTKLGGDYKLLYGTVTLGSVGEEASIPYEGTLQYAQIDFVTTSQGESIGRRWEKETEWWQGITGGGTNVSYWVAQLYKHKLSVKRNEENASRFMRYIIISS